MGMNIIKKFVLGLLIRKVSIKFFYKYCKVCPHFKENNNKHKYYCYLDKTRQYFFNSWKKRILFGDFKLKFYDCIECNKYDRISQKIHYWKDKKATDYYKEFHKGFFDYLKGTSSTITNYKSYIEGYSKAMMLKKNCDDKKINGVIKGDINLNQKLSPTPTPTSASAPIPASTSTPKSFTNPHKTKTP